MFSKALTLPEKKKKAKTPEEEEKKSHWLSPAEQRFGSGLCTEPSNCSVSQMRNQNQAPASFESK